MIKAVGNYKRHAEKCTREGRGAIFTSFTTNSLSFLSILLSGGEKHERRMLFTKVHFDYTAIVGEKIITQTELSQDGTEDNDLWLSENTHN